MIKPEILSESPIGMADLKDELSKIKKRDSKLKFAAEKTEEYLNLFTTLSSKKSAELKEKLEKLKVPRLKEEHVIKLVDLMPQSVEEVKLTLQGYTVTVTNDNLKKISECINKG